MTNRNTDLPTWHEAMSHAAERLRNVEEKYGPGKGMVTGGPGVHWEVSRAWIAYAQEVTNHEALQHARADEAAAR